MITRNFLPKLATLLLAVSLPAVVASAQAATTPPTASAPTTAAAPAANAPGNSAALPTGVSKIAIIDIQKAIIATNEGRRDFETLNKKFDPKSAELKSAQDEIERMKKDLTAQGDKLSEEERGKRVQAIDAKQKLFQRNGEDAQNDYQAQSGEIANRIGQKLIAVMDTYAKQHGIGVVLDVSTQQSNVLWGSEQANISAAVVELYNTQSGIAPPTPSAPRPSTGARATRPAGATTPKQ